MKIGKEKHGKGKKRPQRESALDVYTYTDTYGKRRSIYAHDLSELRKKEQALMKDKFDGIDSVKARNVTLDRMFERYIATKYDLRPNTFHTLCWECDGKEKAGRS